MKRILLTTLATILATFTMAFNDPYSKAMQQGLEMLNTAQSPNDFIEAANKFERISEAENDEWLPGYYASYSFTVSAAMESDVTKKEELLDKAQSQLDKAMENEYDNSEVMALQGFIYMIRIGVDPATRGQQYSGLSGNALQKSMSSNPKNPRTLYMLAQLSYGTAQFFGSDTSEACELNNNALALFKSTDANPGDPFAPNWGQEMAESFGAQCNK